MHSSLFCFIYVIKNELKIGPCAVRCPSCTTKQCKEDKEHKGTAAVRKPNTWSFFCNICCATVHASWQAAIRRGARWQEERREISLYMFNPPTQRFPFFSDCSSMWFWALFETALKNLSLGRKSKSYTCWEQKLSASHGFTGVNCSWIVRRNCYLRNFVPNLAGHCNMKQAPNLEKFFHSPAPISSFWADTKQTLFISPELCNRNRVLQDVCIYNCLFGSL